MTVCMSSKHHETHMFIPENRTLLYSVLLLCYFFSWDHLCLECFAEEKTQNRKQNYSLTFRENPWSKQPRLLPFTWKLSPGRWCRFEVQPFLYNLAYSRLCVHGFTGFTFLSLTTGRNACCVFPCLDKANRLISRQCTFLFREKTPNKTNPPSD